MIRLYHMITKCLWHGHVSHGLFLTDLCDLCGKRFVIRTTEWQDRIKITRSR